MSSTYKESKKLSFLPPTNDEDGKAETTDEVRFERPIINNSDYQQSHKEKLSSTDKDKKSNANQLSTGAYEMIGLSEEEIPIEISSSDVQLTVFQSTNRSGNTLDIQSNSIHFDVIVKKLEVKIRDDDFQEKDTR